VQTGGVLRTFEITGLSSPAEILIDRWGVPHIYAASRDDLFIAQGFNAARDRLFQIDLWRRRGLGLLSEIFGAAYVQHDRAARLFLFRGDMAEEWPAYGPDTERVTGAFVRGVNAFVALCRQDPSYLPPEFAALGYPPAFWDPADVARIRSHGLFHNLEQEVARALILRDFGPEVEELRHVREPAHELRVPEGLDLSLIPDDVLRVYRLATVPPVFPSADPGDVPRSGLDGSNNWVIAGSRTATGRPLLAGDPHRLVSLPSLRYIAHLSAPGIDVIGASEPALPGISIGHNGHLAFGLTIFPIDQEDLYVYRTNPDDPREYRYADGWEPMTRVVESVPVRDADPVEVELWFTRHGPVIDERPDRNAAFAVRAAWLEPGMAPYLGSMDYIEATSPDAFTAAMRRWGAPGENQLYAAPDGTVGWRPAGRVPIRPNWDGTLPVPGDGRYEWAGHHDVGELPSVRDPEAGWFATANEMNLPPDYPNTERTVTYDWYAPFRHDRIAEVLASRTGWTVEDCVRLQTDYLSEPARRIRPLLDGLMAADPRVAAALDLLRGWDGTLSADSAPAALFEIWYRRHLRPGVLGVALRRLMPEEKCADALARITPVEETAGDARVDLDLLGEPGGRLGAPGALRKVLLTTLTDAVAETEHRLGADPSSWRWGSLHQAQPRHPLADLLGEDWTSVGPAPRGGSGDTVGATPYAADFRQTGGATFRMVIDVGGWDESVAMNSPGQSGDPASPHYRDLFGLWALDDSFPLLYSRDRIERELDERLLLRPPGHAG
jgi:penicillin amidase